MEQNLSCNIQDCGVQLTTHAVVTCPVCTQSLNASEVCEQLLQPSEEWKSVALSGLSPTVVMECAGRALGFWSYQMTNQISYQLRKHSKLKEYCAELQGEIENIWGQANQRIITLTTKIRDMEREEHSLKRQCEGLRLALESRSRELAQFQELYSKLKQRVLHGQAQEVPPSVLRSRTPIRAPGAAPESHNRTQPQLGRPTMPASVRTEIPNYFPASPGFPETQPRSEALVEWNTPEIPQRRH
ncbi:hypothetical protein MYCTH_2050486 [Thermothelomyces thermophilus ATCC 42464]|uniref:E3 ubiquitin-protein ligase CCNB1IP1 n=1 Tax=Thermothelomyces thermophilus (strain ATCC 42464 / BCRC 31852 / DSM 1799) TaxID=573729 RepID=G2Q3D3_THET4|nr:uncharacterized protein MYCTH_2050486 [Thermothelomyces thermophilus ATCC 42464]AEO55193.1 hypothetical protein MYCTH_2050486 [Thermothelomyces thermophilus ATCC 42464]